MREDDLKECDCCGKMKPDVRTSYIPHAGDTSACAECRSEGAPQDLRAQAIEECAKWHDAQFDKYAKLAKEAADLQDMTSNGFHADTAQHHMMSAVALRARKSSPISAEAGKALAWSDHEGDGVLTADTSVGHYRIRWSGTCWIAARDGTPLSKCPHETASFAKSEAQADYEARVQSSAEAGKAVACPFCGSKPKRTTRAGSLYEDSKFVSFLSCYCGGYSARAHQSAGADTADEAERAVTKNWNTRASPTALPAPEGALESLRTYQKQLDRDGVFVGVSRQALDEVLDWALQASPQAGDDR
jgi:hypothetical protein